MFISSNFMQPDRDQWKSLATAGALGLALVNVGLMRVIWTKAGGYQESTYKRLSLIHRCVGYTAFGVMIFIAIVTCIGVIGYGGYASRPTWHSFLGISVLALICIKIIAVRKGLPESASFRKKAIWAAIIATIALSVVAAMIGNKGAVVMPFFPLAALLGFIAWKRFGPLPVVGTGLTLSIGLLFASSGGWWFVHQATQGPAPDVAAALAQSGDVEAGRRVFQTNCARCHGADGSGGVGPSLRDARFAYRNTTETIAQKVRTGGSIMPSFSQDKISDQDLASLVAFIRNWYKP